MTMSLLWSACDFADAGGHADGLVMIVPCSIPFGVRIRYPPWHLSYPPKYACNTASRLDMSSLGCLITSLLMLSNHVWLPCTGTPATPAGEVGSSLRVETAGCSSGAHARDALHRRRVLRLLSPCHVSALKYAPCAAGSALVVLWRAT